MHGRTKRDNGERQATRDKRKREHSQVRAQQRRVLCCTPPCARGKHTQKGLYGQTERGRGGAETETPRRKRARHFPASRWSGGWPTSGRRGGGVASDMREREKRGVDGGGQQWVIQHRHIRMHNRQLERADCRAPVDTVQKRPQHSNRSPQRQRAVSAPTCSLGVKVQLRCQRAASAPMCSIGANVQSQHQRQPQCTLAVGAPQCAVSAPM